MLTLPPSVRIYLGTEATDMRKGHDGLAALVTARSQDVYSGHLFVFLSRRRDRAKVLWFDRGGFVLWYKRLERGRFRMPALRDRADTVSLDAAELAMLLDGIDLSGVRRPRTWIPGQARGTKDRRERAGMIQDGHERAAPQSGRGTR
ncbi:MAG: IS66 family insertion sequence element accessory protein TnpB [Deltaproteobacteria bacterium]|nr:IS66 family insertion sequence element accessory protein TnpB [Deltaproteobacteria bacterium]